MGGVNANPKSIHTEKTNKISGSGSGLVSMPINLV